MVIAASRSIARHGCMLSESHAALHHVCAQEMLCLQRGCRGCMQSCLPLALMLEAASPER